MGYEYALFPFGQVKKDDNIIIYGAGLVGKNFLAQVIKENYCKVLFVADKKYDQIKRSYIDVKSPEEISNCENYDYVVIAVLDDKVKQEISDELQNYYHVPAEKIIKPSNNVINWQFGFSDIESANTFAEKNPDYPELIAPKNEVWKIADTTKPIYYIIGYDDPQSSGWTVWERVVLYGSIYAEDHGMIPVVDMQNYKSIYQKKEEFGQVNVWDKYYLQPGGVSLEQALESNNYVLADTSFEWVRYIRMRKPHKITEEYLRKKYSQYIKLQTNIIEKCENTLASIIPDYNKDTRIVALILRGTDYLTHSHPVQPDPGRVVKLAKEIFSKYKCDYYFIGTEDSTLYHLLQKDLPTDKVISFNSGIATNVEGFIGEYLTKTKGEEKAAIDYLTTLYILNKSCCLIGGVCGATIVAKYRRNPPYEYINIIDLKEHY